MHREVGVNDADQGDIGEMPALGDHLCADEDIDLALGWWVYGRTTVMRRWMSAMDCSPAGYGV